MSRRVLWSLIAVSLVAWLGAAALTGPLAGKLSQVQTNDSATFLPESAESTEVIALQKKFDSAGTVPAVIVLQRTGGITGADTAYAGRLIGTLPDGAAGPIPSRDGEALQVVVPLDESAVDVADAVEKLRDTLAQDRPDGLQAWVTGPAGFAADLGGAFAGIDGVLLLVALIVVLVILVLVYRSPILPIAVLLSSVFALALASGAVYLLADNDVITLNGQTQGILSILVVGAATDYALLYVARFREELREHRSRLDALKVAWRQSFEPILASGLTVIIALLCLLVSDLRSTSSLGPVAALGIVASLLSALTFLPALLVLLGRSAFWPVRPRYGSEHPERAGVWGRVADLVTRRARALWVGTAAVLVVFAGLSISLNATGTSVSETFLSTPESVAGQEVLTDHFPGSSASPAIVIGPAAERDRIVEAADVRGVTSVETRRVEESDGLVQVPVVLSAPYDSHAAQQTVQRLRNAVHDAVPDARVGGQTAIDLDTLTTAERDREVVIPLVLAVVFVLLALLLRALVAPLLLLVTVVLSYFATLGVAAVLFNQVLGLPPADPQVPLFGFVFLVALGVDYNIFLMSRVREESRRHGTHEGIRRGLAVTGGVITSAGVVLAATFSALLVIPLVFLAQMAFIVAFGVLLDALVVRSLLVPAAGMELGDRLWWPSRLSRRGGSPSPPT